MFVFTYELGCVAGRNSRTCRYKTEFERQKVKVLIEDIWLNYDLRLSSLPSAESCLKKTGTHYHYNQEKESCHDGVAVM
jgi:hypothetical protein